MAARVKRLGVIWLAATLLLGGAATCSSAQVAALAQKGSAPAQSAAQPDPLGRETPRGTVIGFVRAAQDGNLQVAREYLQPAHGRLTNSNEQQELVDHLLA